MASEGTHKLLSLEDLAIGYSSKNRSVMVSKNISLSLAEGELVSLVGANGIGKSTLLRTIAGMQSALNGSILLNGKNLNNYTLHQLASQLSVVLTEAPASKNLTVSELISLGRQPYTNWMGKLSDADIAAIDLAMKATNTQNLFERKCYELSDGQLQRILIARALAQDTPLILLDEPTTHLDLYHRAYILKLLKNLARETKKTILFSSHEIDLAIQLSDKMIVMATNCTYFDTPENLIREGHFETLFPKDTIDFDSKSGRFTIKN
jgi:iron complex transport system ATP-binding protein